MPRTKLRTDTDQICRIIESAKDNQVRRYLDGRIVFIELNHPLLHSSYEIVRSFAHFDAAGFQRDTFLDFFLGALPNIPENGERYDPKIPPRRSPKIPDELCPGA